MNNDNFYSIDRLVEFGLGIGIAQQMVKSMNHALTNTYVPGPQNPLGQQMTAHAYHVILDNKPTGPFTEPELSRLISEGKVKKDTHVWRPGFAKWELVENVPEVLKLVALAPPPFVPGA